MVIHRMIPVPVSNITRAPTSIRQRRRANKLETGTGTIGSTVQLTTAATATHSAAHTILMLAPVKPRTLEAYRRHWSEFVAWCRQMHLPTTQTADQMDWALSRFLEEAYLDWRRPQSGSLHSGCSDLLQPPVQVFQHGQASYVPAEPPGLEKLN